MLKHYRFSLFAMSLLIACTGYRPAGVAVEDSRPLDEFTAIGIGIHADVFYHTGNTHEITIEGDEKDVEDLITGVKGGMLKLKYGDWKNRRSKLTIHVTSRNLDKVSLSGSGNFYAREKVSSGEMNLAVSGSGQISFASLECDEVDVRISGSGNIVLEKGNADEMDVGLSGSGKLMAEDFQVSGFMASISGSGSCWITALEELDARISGSGSIHYNGSPRIDSRVSGSGKLKSI